jgi:hypothetical protein
MFTRGVNWSRLVGLPTSFGVFKVPEQLFDEIGLVTLLIRLSWRRAGVWDQELVAAIATSNMVTRRRAAHS